MNTFNTLSSRLFAGIGTLTLLGAVGLVASRPAHTAGGPVPVTVTNTVQSRDTDSPARQPYHGFADFGFDGAFSTQNVFPNTPGKRLVIESLTVRNGNFPVNTYSVQLINNTSVDKVGLTIQPTGDPTPIKTQLVHMTVEPGDQLSVSVSSNTVATHANLTVYLSGYYVDIP